MAFCTNCGQKLPEGTKFCTNCGSAVNGENSAIQGKTSFEGQIESQPKKSRMKIVKWILAVFMLSGCFAFGFSFTGIILTLLGVCLLPIKPIENLIDKFLPKKTALRGTIAFVIFAIACCVAPQVETTLPEDSSTDLVTITGDSTGFIAESTVESIFETTTKPTTEPKPDSETTTKPTTEPTITPENSTFEVHFIDVGQADAALVLCDGKAMLIDGGNVGDSNLLYAYLKKYSIKHLDYVVGTHAHEDHIGGLAGALNYATVGTAYCPTTSYDSDAFGNFVKAVKNRGGSLTVPSTGDSFNLGSATCTILAVNTDRNDPNNSSIVLRIVYGDTSFLFAADAERDVEQAILNSEAKINSTVLKVGHHGSDTSTSYVWLREIMPQYAVISVGKDNTYGHPTEAVLSRLRDADVKTFRTDLQGDIICVSDGKKATFTVDRNANADVFGSIGGNSTQKTDPPTTNPPETDPPETEETKDHGRDYVVNKKSKKFHYPSCSSAEGIAASNRWEYHGTREDLIEKGYDPCKRCNP